MYQNDKIAAMYFMVSQTLVKEVLHPLKVFENSFLYLFDCWRKNRYAQRQSQNYAYRNHQHLDAKEKKENFTDEKSFLTLKNVSTDDSDFKVPSKEFDGKLRNLKVQTRSNVNTLLSTDFPLEYSVKNVQQCTSKDIYNENKNMKEQEVNVTRNPYRSYRKSRPENVSFFKNNNREVVKNNECGDEMGKTSTNLAPREKKPNTLANDDRQIFYQNILKAESNNGRKVPIRSHKEFSPRVSVAEINKMKYTSYTDTKTLVNKFSEETKNPYPTKILTKTKFSVNETPKVQKPNSSMKKIEILKRTDKNIDIRQVTPKTIHETNFGLQTPKRQPINGFKKVDEISKNVHAQTPSRIPVKIGRYCPPTPFSQQPVPFTRKATKKLGPSGIILRRGDTGEDVK